jgi:hypothetical protein
MEGVIMKTKLLYPCGIPKPIALVMVGALLFAFCCTECLLAQQPSKNKPVQEGTIYYCGCIEMVTCYGEAPEWPKARIRLLEAPVSMSEITASLLFPARHEQFDQVRYATLFGSERSDKGSFEPVPETVILIARKEGVKETGNK